MPASTKLNRLPTYRLHKASGRAVVTLPSPGLPRGRDVFLGKHGSSESKQKYAQVIAQWSAYGDTLPAARVDITIVELIDRYWQYANRYYAEGSERYRIKSALQPLSELYGLTAVSDFGPLAMKTVRQAMISRGWRRKTVNGQVGCIKRMIAWGVENETRRHHGAQASRSAFIRTGCGTHTRRSCERKGLMSESSRSSWGTQASLRRRGISITLRRCLLSMP